MTCQESWHWHLGVARPRARILGWNWYPIEPSDWHCLFDPYFPQTWDRVRLLQYTVCGNLPYGIAWQGNDSHRLANGIVSWILKPWCCWHTDWSKRFRRDTDRDACMPLSLARASTAMISKAIFPLLVSVQRPYVSIFIGLRELTRTTRKQSHDENPFAKTVIRGQSFNTKWSRSS